MPTRGIMLKGNFTKNKGFTLVELLIVIIIIGILAGAMLLVAGAGTDKARATRIVSNLRNYKAAALIAYSDNGGWPSDIDILDAYLDNAVSSGSYDISVVTSGSLEEHFVGYIGINGESGVRDKLTKMRTNGDIPLKTAAGADYNGEDTGVYLKLN